MRESFHWIPLYPPEPSVRSEGQPRSSPGRSGCPRQRRVLPVRPVWLWRPEPSQGRYEGDHQHSEGLVAGAPEEPVSHQGREDHAGHHHQDDTHTGNNWLSVWRLNMLVGALLNLLLCSSTCLIEEHYVLVNHSAPHFLRSTTL